MKHALSAKSLFLFTFKKYFFEGKILRGEVYCQTLRVCKNFYFHILFSPLSKGGPVPGAVVIIYFKLMTLGARLCLDAFAAFAALYNLTLLRESKYKTKDFLVICILSVLCVLVLYFNSLSVYFLFERIL